MKPYILLCYIQHSQRFCWTVLYLLLWIICSLSLQPRYSGRLQDQSKQVTHFKSNVILHFYQLNQSDILNLIILREKALLRFKRSKTETDYVKYKNWEIRLY